MFGQEKNIKLVITERQDLVHEGDVLRQKAKSEGRELTGIEASRFAVIKREIAAINQDIEDYDDRIAKENPGRKILRVSEMERRGARVEPSAGFEPGARDNGGFASIGDFFGALYRKSMGDFDDRLRPLASTGEGDDAAGGFTVPPQYIMNALEPDFEVGSGEVLLNLCDRILMKTQEVNCPGFADASHATMAPYGITWSQIVESGSFGNVQAPAFKNVKLVAKKSGALFAVSNEFLTDVDGDMQNRIQAIFSASLRWYIENRLWNGSGAGEPLGVLNGPGTLSIPKEIGQPTATIQMENIVNMWARLRPGSHSRAVWAANPTTFPQLATMAVGTGTGGALTGLMTVNNGNGAGAPATVIFGRPLYLTEHLPALGAAGDIVLIDPKLYMLGDRQQVTVDTSSHVNFTTNETMFRAMARWDAQPALSSVLTPRNGATVAGAVMLVAR